VAVYLYAICHAGREAPEGTGMSGVALRTLQRDALAAVVSDHSEHAPAATEQALWQHESVVEHVIEHGDALPVRFGTVLGDDAAVERFLRDHQDALRERLRVVAGAVELGLRAVWREQAPAADVEAHTEDEQLRATDRSGRESDSGVAYLQRQAALLDRAERVAARVHDAVAALARDRRVKVLPHPQVVMSASYLVDRVEVEHFRANVSSLEEGRLGAHLVCTGPWPPYSFVGEEAAA
jgi:hypothetical protein